MDVQAIIRDKVVDLVIVDGMLTEKLDGSNHCRQVFLLNNKYYIKFDNPEEFKDDTCGRQTLSEIELLDQIEEEDKQYFCLPVAWGIIEDLTYTVQEAVEQTREPTESCIEKLHNILRKYNIFGDVGYDEVSGSRNCVFTDSGWKIYDYGLQDI